MEEVLKYLETISVINEIERKLTLCKQGSPRVLSAAEVARLNQAYDAAEAAWAAIGPEFRGSLYPLPARVTKEQAPASPTTANRRT